MKLDYGEEFVFECEGKLVCCPAYPADCDYVRISDFEGNELIYYHSDEWEEEPAFVMGAIMACIGNTPDKIIRRL